MKYRLVFVAATSLFVACQSDMDKQMEEASKHALPYLEAARSAFHAGDIDAATQQIEALRADSLCRWALQERDAAIVLLDSIEIERATRDLAATREILDSLTPEERDSSKAEFLHLIDQEDENKVRLQFYEEKLKNDVENPAVKRSDTPETSSK